MTLRSPWLLLGFLVSMGSALLGAAMLTAPEAWQPLDLPALGLGALWAIAGLIGSARLPFMRLALTPGEIVHVGFLRTRRYAVHEVRSVELIAVDDKLIWEAWAPTLVLDDDERPIMLLAGYTLTGKTVRPGTRLDRQLNLLRQHVSASAMPA